MLCNLVSYVSIASTWHTIKTNCIKHTWDYWSRDMLNFQKSGWDQFLHHILCMIFQEKCFLCYILLTDQISLSDCLYVSNYWATCVLRLLINQAVTSYSLKLTLSFLSSLIVTWPKSQDKNTNILRTKRAF